jgi:hypothetical protein
MKKNHHLTGKKNPRRYGYQKLHLDFMCVGIKGIWRMVFG